MYAFAILGFLIGIVHFAVAFRRPLVSLFVAGVLWLIYAVYEWHVANGVLCTEACNIRVDLVLLLPILITASAYARLSYLRPPGQRTIMGWVLGACGIAVLAMLLSMFGYTAYAAVAGLIAMATAIYAVKLKRSPNPT